MPAAANRSLFAALLCAFCTWSAHAALPVGAPAPDFSADAALGGNAIKFSLSESLKKGPVVLYFYPKAFTGGCTLEAHNFAEATEKFNAMGASVIGMSNDNIDTLKKFSVEACRNKFAVGADAGGKVMKQYDATLLAALNVADRVSYVISPEGRVIYAYTSSSPDKHVENTLAAVQKWKSEH